MKQPSIVFDMDGVLLDTEVLGLRIWKGIGEKYGLKNIEDAVYACMGKIYEASWQVFKGRYGDEIPFPQFKEEEKEGFFDFMKVHGVPLKPGAQDILEYLRSQNYRIALATSTEVERAKWELTQAGLYYFFDYVVGGDMVSKSKPEPDIYLHACQGIAADPAVTYGVEDSLTGVRAASSAGLKTVMIPDRVQPDDETRARCVSVESDLYGLKRFLELR